MRKRTIRLSEQLVDQTRGQSKNPGCATASAFMQAAIERGLQAPRRRLIEQQSASPPRLTTEERSAECRTRCRGVPLTLSSPSLPCR